MTPKRKKKFVNDSIDWLRNNDPGRIDSFDDPTAEALTNLAGISMPITSQTDRSKAIAEAVEWLRNNDPNMNKVDKPTLKSLTKFAGIPMPNKLTPKSKTKAMDKFLDWLRNNNINPD